MATRLKDFNWVPGNDDGSAVSWERVQVALLLDIRDELKKLNRVFECYNFVRIPNVLDAIRTNTSKPRRKRRSA